MSSWAESLVYDALSQPVTKADISAFRAAELSPGTWRTKFMPILAVLAATAIVCIAVLIWFSGNGDLITSLMFSGPFAIIGLLAYIVARHRTKKLARLYKFASANGIKLIHDRYMPLHSGLIFDEGHSRLINEGFVFPDGTEIANYTYVTGGGKNQQTHKWGFVRVKLARRLPHMVLDAHKNNLFGRISNLPDSFRKDQELKLEGDFNDYFTLYAPKRYKRDALYVFTPDVMAAVIDTGKSYDMEVVDDDLMLYSAYPVKLDSVDTLKALLKVIDTISHELRSQTDYYADERIADRDANVVAGSGRRLKPGVGLTGIIVIIAFGAYFLFVVWQFIMAWL